MLQGISAKAIIPQDLEPMDGTAECEDKDPVECMDVSKKGRCTEVYADQWVYADLCPLSCFDCLIPPVKPPEPECELWIEFLGAYPEGLKQRLSYLKEENS